MKRIIGILNQIEEWTLVLTLLALAGLTAVQVFCRYVLNFSFDWFQEVGRYGGVFIAFLGAALGVKYGSHFAMDLIYERVSNDRFRHALKVFINTLGAVTFLVVAWYGWEQAMKLRQFGAITSALELPKYWTCLPIPIFSALMAYRFFNLAAKHFQGLLRNEPFAPGADRP
ncbi:MAG: TRAP transporter small permease [Thermodesulfobacteriota bacterium]